MKTLILYVLGRCAAWRPSHDRDDYLDENTDLVEGYFNDGKIWAALSVAMVEFQRTVFSVKLPTWFRKSGRLWGGMLIGAIYNGLLLWTDTGSGFLTLTLVALVAALPSLVFGLVSGRIRGTQSSYGFRFDAVAYTVSISFFMWVAASYAAGWPGFAVGLLCMAIAVLLMVPAINVAQEANTQAR